jgi:hypothetical protein
MDELEDRIYEYQMDGWIPVSQTSDTAQLRKPKKFGFIRFILFLIFIPLTAGIGSIFLLLDYWTRRDGLILLIDDGKGSIKTKKLSY